MRDEYPPLVSLEELPLHRRRRGDPRDFACRSTAASFDDVLFDWRCIDCVQVAVGFVDAGQDDEVDWHWRSDDGVDHGPVMLSWLAARSMFWLRGTP